MYSRLAAFLALVLPVLLPAAGRSARPYELAFSTYLGGSGWEHARDICADAAGNIYVVGGTGPNDGGTGSNNFPTTPGAYATNYNAGVSSGTGVGAFGTCDAFVTKYNASGQLLWSTFVGGPAYDRAYAVEVDAAGYVYIAGRAGPGFPTTSGALQTNFAGTTSGTGNYGSQNAFVAKLSPSGSNLIWATYLGVGELVRDFDIDDDGDVYALLTRAATSSSTMPPAFANAFTNAFRPIWGAGTECGMAKIKGDGSGILWATWLGGSGDDSTSASLRVNRATKCPVVLFYTTSTNVVTAGSGAVTTNAGGNDLVVAALNDSGSALQFATYLGGSGDESTETHGLALDAQGNAYVAASSTSSNFPVTPGTISTNRRGPIDITVAKIGTNAQRLVSTYVGGDSGDSVEGVYVDGQGRIIVSGGTSSTNFPVTATNAFQGAKAGGGDAVLFVLSADMTRMDYSTHLGGTTNDTGRTCFLGPDGALYVAGQTISTNWPTRHAADATFGGGDHPFAPGSGDAFLAKFCRTDDFDGDGQSDIDEFTAGTSTLDDQDFLAVRQLWRDAAGAHTTVAGQRGRYYVLWRTTDFSAWANITQNVTLASPQSVELVDPNPPPPPLLYGVQAVLP